MLFYNIFTNLIGAWIIVILSFRSISPPFYEIADFAHRVNIIAIPIFFISIFIIQISYERPIRGYLNSIKSNKIDILDTESKAKRRLLNAPFFIIGIDFTAWITSAILYSFLYREFIGNELAANRVFYQNILVGLITTTATFFVLEQILQNFLAPHFFPNGGLYMTPKTARIRISTRLAAFIFAVNLIPFFAFLMLIQGTYGTNLSSSILLDHIRSGVVTNSLISICVGICLTIFISFNFNRPLKDIISALKRIREGYLDKIVRVTTNDELGYTGDVINKMATGLKERERMKQSLELAKEVQFKLLPRQAPNIDGLDIAGISQYCDETGGDYYDYLLFKDSEGDKIGVVIGDVSDHGIHSALLMTTARAFIRLRSSNPGNIADIVSDVNFHLTMDIGDGGQFMTLFFLLINNAKGTLDWVRAGHDPAIIYDPSTGITKELKGKGIPLGIDKNYQFQVNEMAGIAYGQIIVLGTDGIWEARNRKGELFGKDRFFDLIRKNAILDAKSILNMIIEKIEEFQNGFKKEDDITLVVIKINNKDTYL